METPRIQRVIGRLESTTQAHGEALRELKEMMSDQTVKLDLLVNRSERERGGRKALLAVGSVLASVFGAGAAMAFEYFTSGHP